MSRGDATWYTESRWLAARSVAAETIPAFGAVRVSGVGNADGLISVGQPNADNQGVYFNGPFDVAVTADGLVTRDWPAWALYESSDGTPAQGEEWGVRAGGYKLRRGQTGYIIVGGAADERVLVEDAGGSGGGGPGGFWARIVTQNCTQGSHTITEMEPVAYPTLWQDRVNGVINATAYHAQSRRAPYDAGGPLVEPGTIVWARPGFSTDYRFNCPAGWTGTKQYAKIVECAGVPPQLRVLYYYEQMWNGSTIKPPCWDQNSPICSTCPSDPPPPP